MPDLPKELWGVLGTALGVLGTIILGLLKARRDDQSTAANIRDELRGDNEILRARLEVLEQRVTAMADERLVLKRALDLRDHKIRVLETTVEELKAGQARLEETSEPDE